jgi:hypothetical protein
MKVRLEKLIKSYHPIINALQDHVDRLEAIGTTNSQKISLTDAIAIDIPIKPPKSNGLSIKKMIVKLGGFRPENYEKIIAYLDNKVVSLEHHIEKLENIKSFEKSKVVDVDFKPELLAPLDAITGGEIDRNGVYINFQLQNQPIKQNVWGEDEYESPLIGETCFQPKFENAYYNPEVPRRCIHNASVLRIPQCYKLRYKNPLNTPQTPEYTIVRLIPAGPNSCYFYEYLPTEKICPNLTDMCCLQGPSENCSRFKKAAA